LPPGTKRDAWQRSEVDNWTSGQAGQLSVDICTSAYECIVYSVRGVSTSSHAAWSSFGFLSFFKSIFRSRACLTFAYTTVQSVNQSINQLINQSINYYYYHPIMLCQYGSQWLIPLTINVLFSMISLLIKDGDLLRLYSEMNY